MRRGPVVAIDGPSGAGKTTVSRRLAERAGLVRLDTGAMYRAVALAAKRAGIPWSDPMRLGGLCAGLQMEFRREGSELRLFLAGEDVSGPIRTPEISMGASAVSAHGSVREAMVALQRTLGESGGVVAEGRDTGTVVFPGADAKFFLDAAAAVRARRRWLEEAGREGVSFEGVYRDVLRRDVQDSTRDISPLRVAPDAVYVNSTVLSVDAVVAEMLMLLGALPERRPEGGPGR